MSLKAVSLQREVSVDSKYAPYLARVFSAPVIAEIACAKKSPLMTRILSECAVDHQLDLHMKLRDVFDAVYSCVSKSYRNEYVYKNTLAQKILLEKHTLNSAFMLTELRVGDSKADVVILNGTSHVYEIKTELDTIERLEKQINSYMSFFDLITIVVPENQKEKVSMVVGEDVGVLVLSDANKLYSFRKPASRKFKVDNKVIFDTLRKSEYTKIIKSHHGCLPNVSNAYMYKECKNIFERLPPATAHDYMVEALKQRGCGRMKRFVEMVPDSLKAVALSCKLSQSQRNNFVDSLGCSLKNCLA